MSLLSLFLLSLTVVIGREYKGTDPVPLVVSKLFSQHNPSEVYSHTFLHTCFNNIERPRYKRDVGDAVFGFRKLVLPYSIAFLLNTSNTVLCKANLSLQEVSSYQYAIEQALVYELQLDDLPARIHVGEILSDAIPPSNTYKLYNHISFTIGYHNQHIVYFHVNTTSSNALLVLDKSNYDEAATPTYYPITFSYTVTWISRPDIAYSNRMSIYERNGDIKNDVLQWQSILIYALLLLLIYYFTITVLYPRKHSMMAVTNKEEAIAIVTAVSSATTSTPSASSSLVKEHLLAAMTGAGAQLFITLLFLLIALSSGLLKTEKATYLWIIGIVFYALCGLVGGLVSGMIFRHLPVDTTTTTTTTATTTQKKKNYLFNTILTCCLYPFPFIVIVLCITRMSMEKGLVQLIIPPRTFLLLGGMFVFVQFPMTLAGNAYGRVLLSTWQPSSQSQSHHHTEGRISQSSLLLLSGGCMLLHSVCLLGCMTGWDTWITWYHILWDSSSYPFASLPTFSWLTFFVLTTCIQSLCTIVYTYISSFFYFHSGSEVIEEEKDTFFFFVQAIEQDRYPIIDWYWQLTLFGGCSMTITHIVLAMYWWWYVGYTPMRSNYQMMVYGMYVALQGWGVFLIYGMISLGTGCLWHHSRYDHYCRRRPATATGVATGGCSSSGSSELFITEKKKDK